MKLRIGWIRGLFLLDRIPYPRILDRYSLIVKADGSMLAAPPVVAGKAVSFMPVTCQSTNIILNHIQGMDQCQGNHLLDRSHFGVNAECPILLQRLYRRVFRLFDLAILLDLYYSSHNGSFSGDCFCRQTKHYHFRSRYSKFQLTITLIRFPSLEMIK